MKIKNIITVKTCLSGFNNTDHCRVIQTCTVHHTTSMRITTSRVKGTAEYLHSVCFSENN